MNRKAFYDHIRANLTWRTWRTSGMVPQINPFKHRMFHFQVRGMEVLLDEADKRGWLNRNHNSPHLYWLAYVLATAYWETARTITPIREYGRGRGKSYGIANAKTGQKYYGRGFVQLTWLYNYIKAGLHLDIDLVNFPDLAMDLKHAAAILFGGMEKGWFTGRRLDHYFNNERLPLWKAARRIVNGQDKATEIAKIAKIFYTALLNSHQPKD